MACQLTPQIAPLPRFLWTSLQDPSNNGLGFQAPARVQIRVSVAGRLPSLLCIFIAILVSDPSRAQPQTDWHWAAFPAFNANRWPASQVRL